MTLQQQVDHLWAALRREQERGDKLLALSLAQQELIAALESKRGGSAERMRKKRQRDAQSDAEVTSQQASHVTSQSDAVVSPRLGVSPLPLHPNSSSPFNPPSPAASGAGGLNFDEVQKGMESGGLWLDDETPCSLGWFFGWVQGFREHKGWIAEHEPQGLAAWWAEVEKAGCANGRIQRAFADYVNGNFGPKRKPLSFFMNPTVWRTRVDSLGSQEETA